MSDTIPDIILDNLNYQNLNTLTGIAVGTRVILQFKGSGILKVQTKPSQPTSSSSDGIQMEALDFYIVDEGESAIWVKGTGRLSVQAVA